MKDDIPPEIKVKIVGHISVNGRNLGTISLKDGNYPWCERVELEVFAGQLSRGELYVLELIKDRASDLLFRRTEHCLTRLEHLEADLAKIRINAWVANRL